MKTTKMKISILLIIAFTFVSNITLASSNQDSISHGEALHNSGVNPHGEEHEHLIEKKAFDTDFIMDHVVDSYGWHLWDWPINGWNSGEYKAVEIHLPIILMDGGLNVFSSGNFNHGHDVVEHNGNHYVLYKNKIYKSDADGSMTFSVPRIVKDEEFESSLAYMSDFERVLAKEMHQDSTAYDVMETNLHEIMEGQVNVEGAKLQNIVPWDFSITKSVIALFVTVLLMLFFFLRTARFYRKKGALVAPKGMAAIFEPIILFVRDDIAIPNIGETKYKKFMPYLLTVFFFIWITNMVGLLPFGFNLTGNIAVTFVLALFTMILTTFNGKRNYWGHIFWMPGVPVAMKIFLAPIEVIGMFAKPFALMIRLFANMTAGHIVVMSLIGLIFIKQSMYWGMMSVPMTLFISLLELLVAALQAYVFTMLSALFIGSAVEEAHQ